MICKKCGAEIPDFASFCTFCGAPAGNSGVDLSKPSSAATKSAPPPGYSEPISRDYAGPAQQPGLQSTIPGYIPAGSQSFQSMGNGITWAEIKRAGYIIGDDGRRYNIGWLKFILYVQLFVSAASCLFNAISYFTGAVYGGNARLVYAVFGGLFALDMVMGIISLALCAGSIVVRFMLSGLRRFAPWAYLGLHIANLVISVIYLSVVWGITGISIGDLIDTQTVSSILVSIVMLAVNFVYFKHRSSVFKN